jgi:hypothetical protein
MKPLDERVHVVRISPTNSGTKNGQNLYHFEIATLRGPVTEPNENRQKQKTIVAVQRHSPP